VTLMPLAHAIVEPPSGKAEKWMLFLHGILGSGANWRTFARAFVKERPEWGAVLVDLRLHGDSTIGLAPPHTVAAAAADVHELFALVPGPVRAVLAHSFGGKVALALDDRLHGDLDHLFVIDATPGARPDARGSESTRHIVDLLSSLPEELASRDDFMKLVEERGVTRPIAMWLAMNVRPVPNTTKFVFRIDVAAVKEMLADYFAIDLWPIVEKDEGAVQKHLVVGGKSSVVDEADRERWRRAVRTTVDVIEEAGHWVHADAPDALRRIVVRQISGESG
jgi:esterase